MCPFLFLLSVLVSSLTVVFQFPLQTWRLMSQIVWFGKDVQTNVTHLRSLARSFFLTLSRAALDSLCGVLSHNLVVLNSYLALECLNILQFHKLHTWLCWSKEFSSLNNFANSFKSVLVFFFIIVLVDFHIFHFPFFFLSQQPVPRRISIQVRLGVRNAPSRPPRSSDPNLRTISIAPYASSSGFSLTIGGSSSPSSPSTSLSSASSETIRLSAFDSRKLVHIRSDVASYLGLTETGIFFSVFLLPFSSRCLRCLSPSDRFFPFVCFVFSH